MVYPSIYIHIMNYSIMRFNNVTFFRAVLFYSTNKYITK